MSHLNKNVDFNAKDRLGLTPFMKPCINGHKEVVKILFGHSDSKTTDLNAKGIQGLTPFIKACINGHKEVVKLLFDHSDSKMRHFWGIFQHCDVSLESNIIMMIILTGR